MGSQSELALFKQTQQVKILKEENEKLKGKLEYRHSADRELMTLTKKELVDLCDHLQGIISRRNK